MGMGLGRGPQSPGSITPALGSKLGFKANLEAHMYHKVRGHGNVDGHGG